MRLQRELKSSSFSTVLGVLSRLLSNYLSQATHSLSPECFLMLGMHLDNAVLDPQCDISLISCLLYYASGGFSADATQSLTYIPYRERDEFGLGWRVFEILTPA